MSPHSENNYLNASISPKTPLETLHLNYECLNRTYRAGGFEDKLGKLQVWRDQLTNQDLCLLSPVLENLPDDRIITFRQAINELSKLTREVDMQDEVFPRRKLLLLRCRILIYEATDYFLAPENDLAGYFITSLDQFLEKFDDLEPLAEELNDGPFGDDMDGRARMIKVLLLAALSGINARYRKHDRLEADRALRELEQIINYIECILPELHKNQRPSYGLLGIAYYLKARMLSSRDLFNESRKAFRKSSDAYLGRLRQKEVFLEEGHLKPEEYREKVSLTIRRSALVTAFGDGYLSFVASRLSDALEALTVARAALAQNSGKVNKTYVDMLYFTCLGAQHSSDPEKLETAIKGLARCYKTFGELVPNT